MPAAIIGGCLPHAGLEGPVEKGPGPKAQFRGYLVYALLGAGQNLLGLFDAAKLDVVVDGTVGFRLEPVGEIVFGIAQPSRQQLDGQRFPQMGFDIVDTALNGLGIPAVGAAFVHPADKIIVPIGSGIQPSS